MFIVFIYHENTDLLILPSLVFKIMAKVRLSVMAVLICITKCPKGPRGHHPVSQSRVYQDTKNAINVVIWTPMDA